MCNVCEGGATLIFSIELIELKKPSAINWDRDTITIVGVVLLVGMLLVEVYRRFKKEHLKEQKGLKKGKKKR